MDAQSRVSDALEHADLPFEIDGIETKQDEDGNEVGEFEGLAAAFDNLDLVGDIIKAGSFKGTIKSPKKIKMLWQHNSDMPVGVWKQFEETEKGLFAKGNLILGVRQADEAQLLMKAKALDGLSIGFRIPNKGSEFDDQTGVRTITKIDLWEVSLVTFPANPKSRISRVKAMAQEVKTIRDFENLLHHECGFTVNQARAIAEHGWKDAAELLAGADAGRTSELLGGADDLDELSEALIRRAGIWN